MTRLIIFAKAPWPGHAKTRLIPRLGEEGATNAHKALVNQAVETALATKHLSIEIHCNAYHPFFTRLSRRFKISCKKQIQGHLGQKIFNALSESNGKTLLMGSDCAGIQSTHLIQCEQALNNHDMVFLPAEDGGYGLVGVKNKHIAHLNNIFEEIDWGSHKVMMQTRQQLKNFGISYCEPAIIWDVDNPDDFDRWQATLKE